MAVEVKCCNYNGDPRVIDKKPQLIKTLECRITDPSEVVNPRILLTYTKEIERCNYFVIGFRKYFKETETKYNSRMIEISLHEDVLSTWMPRVYVIGIISNATEIVSEDVQQDYLLDAHRRISRIIAHGNNDGGDVLSDHVIVVQSPQDFVPQPTT